MSFAAVRLVAAVVAAGLPVDGWGDLRAAEVLARRPKRARGVSGLHPSPLPAQGPRAGFVRSAVSQGAARGAAGR